MLSSCLPIGALGACVPNSERLGGETVTNRQKRRGGAGCVSAKQLPANWTANTARRNTNPIRTLAALLVAAFPRKKDHPNDIEEESQPSNCSSSSCACARVMHLRSSLADIRSALIPLYSLILGVWFRRRRLQRRRKNKEIARGFVMSPALC